MRARNSHEGDSCAPILPSRQDAFPIRINVFAHFGFVVALAITTLGVALSSTRELIVVQLDAEPGFVRDADAAADDGDPAAEDNFVLRRLPGVMGVAGVREVRSGGGDVGHRHERHSQMRVRVHREAEAKCFG